jgi:hypothetical protein
MLLSKWKVKRIIASIIIIDYRQKKGRIPVKISGCYITRKDIAGKAATANSAANFAVFTYRVFTPRWTGKMKNTGQNVHKKRRALCPCFLTQPFF